MAVLHLSYDYSPQQAALAAYMEGGEPLLRCW